MDIVSERSIFKNHMLFYCNGKTYRVQRRANSLYNIFEQRNSIFIHVSCKSAKSYIGALKQFLHV